MFLIDSIITLFTLRWTKQEPTYRPLPSCVKRTYVKSKGGDLELLICEPKSTGVAAAERQPPVFFVHGGFGSAGVYLEWMEFLHNHDYSGTLYSYSARNHGASYTLPYWQMVFNTPFEHIQADMVACLNHTIKLEEQSSSLTRLPILIGHSSGGGVIQYVLSGVSSNPSLRFKASGLGLVGAIPHYGSYDMYWNWLKHDPWFPLRSLLYFQHPNSPLSTDQLVHDAFFGHMFPRSLSASFRQWMPAFESMGWPVGMLGNSFLGWLRNGNKWLSAGDIVSNIEGAGDGRDKVCVMVGEEDMMYRPWMWKKEVQEYRDALKTLNREGLREAVADESIEAVTTTSRNGVRLIRVEDSGHHVQNDVHRDKAAEALLYWLNQV